MEWKPLVSVPIHTNVWLTNDGSQVHTGYAEQSGTTFQCFYRNGSEICGMKYWMKPVLPTTQSDISHERYSRTICEADGGEPDEGGKWQPPYGTEYARTLSTEKLKELWDRYDGSDDTIGDDNISGEAIHLVLNERKEGSYCAV